MQSHFFIPLRGQHDEGVDPPTVADPAVKRAVDRRGVLIASHEFGTSVASRPFGDTLIGPVPVVTPVGIYRLRTNGPGGRIPEFRVVTTDDVRGAVTEP